MNKSPQTLFFKCTCYRHNKQMLSVSELARFWELRNLLAHHHLRFKYESTDLSYFDEDSINESIWAPSCLCSNITVIITDNATSFHWWSMSSITSHYAKLTYLLFYIVIFHFMLLIIYCHCFCHVYNIMKTLFEISDMNV